MKEAFAQLVTDLLLEIPELDNDITMAPKDAIFRINKDIRFSKDKTPYNTIVKAGFAKGGRKSSYAGFYLGIDADHIHLGGGVYSLPTPDLKKLRMHIASNSEEIEKLAKEKEFVDVYGKIQGETITRIPTEFKAAFEITPLIANKQFYYMTKYATLEHLDNKNLKNFILDHFKIILPLNQYLKSAFD